MITIKAHIASLEQAIKLRKAKLELYRHIQKLWDEFKTIPIDPETDCIQGTFAPRSNSPDKHVMAEFKPGTPRQEIWDWFGETFDINVKKQLAKGDET